MLVLHGDVKQPESRLIKGNVRAAENFHKSSARTSESTRPKKTRPAHISPEIFNLEKGEKFQKRSEKREVRKTYRGYRGRRKSKERHDARRSPLAARPAANSIPYADTIYLKQRKKSIHR